MFDCEHIEVQKAHYCQLGMLGRVEFKEKFFMATNIVLLKKNKYIFEILRAYN